jgi:hypothetical protein
LGNVLGLGVQSRFCDATLGHDIPYGRNDILFRDGALRKEAMNWTDAQILAKGFRWEGGELVRNFDSGGVRINLPLVPNPKPAIRIPKRRIPNATEQRWKDDHSHLWPVVDFRYEEVSFRLPSGCLYTPDWTLWHRDRLTAAVEVKGAFLGHAARSILAWKEAAAEWPAVTFIFAQWKDGEWAESEIKAQ